jgi:hypothetical protein
MYGLTLIFLAGHSDVVLGVTGIRVIAAVHRAAVGDEDDQPLADMEIMFPQRRFVILPDLRSLPQVLPKLYVKLTA